MQANAFCIRMAASLINPFQGGEMEDYEQRDEYALPCVQERLQQEREEKEVISQDDVTNLVIELNLIDGGIPWSSNM